jgi:hypothetical protein
MQRPVYDPRPLRFCHDRDEARTNTQQLQQQQRKREFWGVRRPWGWGGRSITHPGLGRSFSCVLFLFSFHHSSLLMTLMTNDFCFTLRV